MSTPSLSRLVVTQQIYHHPEGGECKSFAPAYSRALSSDEQVYERSLRAYEGQWELVNHGWIYSASMVLIENGLPNYQTIPTSEQRALDSRRVLEVSFDGMTPHLRVAPGESCRFEPSDLTNLWLRCASGETRYTMTVVPS